MNSPEGVLMAMIDAELAEIPKPRSGVWAHLREGFEAQAIFIIFAVAFLSIFQIAKLFNSNIVVQNPLWIFIGMSFLTAPVAILVMLLFQLFFVYKKDNFQKPAKNIWRRTKGIFTHRDTLVRGLPMYAALCFLSFGFAIFKSNIPNISPYAWDLTFDHWDKMLHFGMRPYELLQPVLGNAIATFILSLNYSLWFFVLKGFFIYFAFFHAPGLERTRVFLAFFLVWTLGGGLTAVLLSSAGPCYFDLVAGGANPYAQHMQQLRDFNNVMPILSVEAQQQLWDLRTSGSALGGVSAMPSMHNATSLLFVLVAWNKSKFLRNLMIVHMVLIFLGSIHLGWHYALDSYVAWAIAGLFWIAAYEVALWWEAHPRVQAFNTNYATSI
jgi:PAP2 superfamily